MWIRLVFLSSYWLILFSLKFLSLIRIQKSKSQNNAVARTVFLLLLAWIQSVRICVVSTRNWLYPNLPRLFDWWTPVLRFKLSWSSVDHSFNLHFPTVWQVQQLPICSHTCLSPTPFWNWQEPDLWLFPSSEVQDIFFDESAACNQLSESI